MEEQFFKFDLQLFADGGTGDDGGGEGKKDGDKGSGDINKDIAKPYTQADIDSAIASKLANEKTRWEKEYQEKAAAAKLEQDRLSKLSDDERQKVELENSKIELALKEKELKAKEIKLEMVDVLAKRGLPISFMDYLVDESSEKTLSRITNFEKEFKKAIESAVTERLKGKTPRAGGERESDNNTNKSGFLDSVRKAQVQRS